MVSLLQRSEGHGGKRVGFGQAHTSSGLLVERAHASVPLGYGQLAPTTVLRNPEERAFLGDVGERVVVIRVESPRVAKTVASVPSSGLVYGMLQEASSIQVVIHSRRYPIQRHTADQLEEMLPVCEYRLTRSRAPEDRDESGGRLRESTQNFSLSPKTGRIAHPSHSET